MHLGRHCVPTCASLLAACLSAAPALAAEQAGVSAAVRGEVKMAAAAIGPVGRLVRSGEPIHMGDRIVSGPAAGMQIMLLDQTVFTIGPDSEISIDRFVYDPRSGAGQLAANVRRGVFRFISGKVTQNRPDNVRIQVGSATIGIRGTIVAGRVRDDGEAEILLLGPGPEDNSGARRGRITVSNAGRTVEVLRPGFGTVIKGSDQPPQPPFRFPPEAAGGLLGALTPSLIAATMPTAPGGPGTLVADAPAISTFTNQALAVADSLVSETLQVEVGQELLSNLATETLKKLAQSDITTFEQLYALAGSASFIQNNVPLQAILIAPDTTASGNYSFSLNVDFGGRTFSYFVDYGIVIMGPNMGSGFTAAFGGGPTSFSGRSGETLFTEQVGSDIVKVRLRNTGGAIAGAAEHSVTLGGLNGSGIAPRQ
ncbi:MAG: FecR domain-containing protein [Alphaproteobacteria bacterium]|nr:FecR domain-containing protein [Alphaproteobacteria bacterium]